MLLSRSAIPSDFIGSYGPCFREGLLSEHLDMFVQAGGTHHASRSDGAGWAVVDGRAIPVVCSELVWIDTEDGRIDGRCGANALAVSGTCPAHEYTPCTNHFDEPGILCPTCRF